MRSANQRKMVAGNLGCEQFAAREEPIPPMRAEIRLPNEEKSRDFDFEVEPSRLPLILPHHPIRAPDDIDFGRRIGGAQRGGYVLADSAQRRAKVLHDRS